MERHEIRAAILKVMYLGVALSSGTIARRAGLDINEVWDLGMEMVECNLLESKVFANCRFFALTTDGNFERMKVNEPGDS